MGVSAIVLQTVKSVTETATMHTYRMIRPIGGKLSSSRAELFRRLKNSCVVRVLGLLVAAKVTVPRTLDPTTGASSWIGSSAHADVTTGSLFKPNCATKLGITRKKRLPDGWMDDALEPFC